MGDTPPLQIRNLCVSLDSSGTKRILNDISFSLVAGSSLGIVGESGSGKSTLAMSLLGLLNPPLRMTAGSILFRGQPIEKLKEKEWRKLRGRDVAMIFQEPLSALNPLMRCGEQVAEVMMAHLKWNRTRAESEVLRLFEQVGIADPKLRMRAYPHELSGGMRQRVMIAIALACGPEILIADEPTTALDVTIQAQILALLSELQRTRQMAMILVTHDLGIVAEHCDRVLVLYKGEAVEEGPVQEVFRAPQHPYTRSLLDVVRTPTEVK